MRGWLLLAATLAGGCTSTVETVDHRMLLQPGTAQYRMAELDLFVMPMELEAPLPAFPADVVAGDVPAIEACAELWLSSDGEVTRVAALHDLPGCSGGGAAAPFEQAVVQTLGQWSFTPARVCRFREDQRAQREQGDCRGDVEIERVPVRLAYAFRFERRHGRAEVGSRRLGD
ncbi:MAG TPA: hypothetical protein VFK18_05585 [Luteimonas sp.]|nr:hypothetical protein [Luteimonas sp.]